MSATGTEGGSTGAAPPGPIFVVGSMRSGSTLLRLVLDSHPNIAVGPESGFVGALLATKEIPNWRLGKGWYERFGWTEDELDERLRDFYDGIFRRYASRQGKPRWGEKTPFHTGHMKQMARVFTDGVFVGIVRHPGAVAASLRKNFHYTFEEALSYWSVTNMDMIRSGAELGDRFLLCRYEDLVLEGEPPLRELFEFLHEPWSANVLEHHRVQREKRAPRLTDGGTITREPIDADRAVRWSSSVTEADRRALERASPMARFLGYEPVDAERRSSIASSAAREWTLTGTEVGARLAGRDLVDPSVQPPGPLPDMDREELAARLARVERTLARVRSRRLVRTGDALRRVQKGRSVADVRSAWALLRARHGGEI
jgi:hypothetical protein